jgi:ABC-type tungstate transport system permease subunit
MKIYGLDIKKLTASDFPGIDEAKFNEWKALKIKRNREHQIIWYIAIGIGFISGLLIAGRYLLIALVIFSIAEYGFYLVRSKHLRQLGKELKMSDRIWAKKKGRAFTE